MKKNKDGNYPFLNSIVNNNLTTILLNYDI